MKKTFLLFLLFSGLLSCFCRDVKDYWNITDFHISISETNTSSLDTTII